MFLFVDRIFQLEPGKSAVGVKHVTRDDVFVRHQPSGPSTLLPCIVGEALGQLGAWVVMQAHGFRLRPVAGLVGDARILGAARVGDAVRLETTIDSLTEEAVAYHAVATVNGKEVLTLDSALGPLLPMEQFSDPAEVRDQLAAIHRPGPWEEPTRAKMPSGGADPSAEVAFDEVVSRDEGVEVVGRKRIPVGSAFFRDHFARKPVFPLSLLLESLLQLGHEELLSEGDPLQPVRLRNVKMRRFLAPGDELLGRVRVRERSADRARLQFHCETGEGRVCTAEADFAPAGTAVRT